MPTFQFSTNDHPTPVPAQSLIEDILAAAGERTDLSGDAIIESRAFFENYENKFSPVTDVKRLGAQLSPVLTSALLEIAPSWIVLFLKETVKIREALECICEGGNGGPIVTSTILGKPENLQITYGQPQPDVFAAGWVVYYDAEGYYGERQFIFTDRQVFRPNIPKPVGYDTYTMPGFNIVFAP
jgi:hypothetical protein